MLTSSVKNLETGFCVFYQSISMFCCKMQHRFPLNTSQATDLQPSVQLFSSSETMLSFWQYAYYCIDDWQSWRQPVPVQCINSHPLKHFNLISLSLLHSCSSISHLLLHCLHYKLIVIILVRVMVKHAVPEPNRFMSVKNKTHKRFMASHKRHERIMTLDGD